MYTGEIWYMWFILQVGARHNASHSELYFQMFNLQTLACCHYICNISYSHELKTYIIFSYLSTVCLYVIFSQFDFSTFSTYRTNDQDGLIDCEC